MFVHVAKGFRLPEDPDKPIIMVGPGTGVAPFRAYLQERKVTGASGKNWLFFGEQRSQCDYFYQEEFESLRRDGVLTNLHTAFSRDQDHKVYVQHRLLENAKEVYAWLQEGAHFYVCGDEARMAKDVDVALHQIVEKEGGLSPEAAAAYVEALKKEKRYKRDVY
jgi:sulfite reductase (NADPH) flavoprotein alpha-component